MVVCRREGERQIYELNAPTFFLAISVEYTHFLAPYDVGQGVYPLLNGLLKGVTLSQNLTSDSNIQLRLHLRISNKLLQSSVSHTQFSYFSL